MKKLLSIVLIIGMFLIPLNVSAINLDDYNTTDFKETLKIEGLTLLDESYTPSDDKINIYLFRGDGCKFCHSFIEHLNNISKEYGKYFNLVSFETSDSKNSGLFNEVANFLNKDSGGVPFIVIGEEVFVGYGSQYDDAILSAITKLYNQNKDERYDVFSDMESKNSSSGTTVSSDIIKWMVILTIVLFIAIVIKTNSDKNEIIELINSKHKK